MCECLSGYENFNETNRQCSDINECAGSELNECSEFALCENTEGSYRCLCLEQYEDTSNGAGTECTARVITLALEPSSDEDARILARTLEDGELPLLLQYVPYELKISLNYPNRRESVYLQLTADAFILRVDGQGRGTAQLTALMDPNSSSSSNSNSSSSSSSSSSSGIVFPLEIEIGPNVTTKIIKFEASSQLSVDPLHEQKVVITSLHPKYFPGKMVFIL